MVGTLSRDYYQQRILSLTTKGMTTCAAFKLLSGGSCKGGRGFMGLHMVLRRSGFGG